MAKNSNTVNRGWLKRRIEAGEIEAKCSYRYTDDYAWDAATDFGKTDWAPAAVVADNQRKSDGPKGHIVFWANDFRGYGSAWKNPDGTMTLYFGYTSFELRFKQPETVKEAA